MRLKKIIIIVVLMFLLTGCKGDDVRSFRSIGYNLSNANFKCDYVDSFKFLGDDFAVGSDDRLYSISYDLIYKNKNNCKIMDKNLKVSAVYNNEIVKMNNGFIYKINDENKLDQVSEKENNIVYYFLKDDNNVKIIEYSNIYYIMKQDGNVYKYIVSDNDGTLKVAGVEMLQNVYGGSIVDFNITDNKLTMYFKTNEKYYRNQIVNEECLKYADVLCEYQIKEDAYLNKYRNIIQAYNGDILILNSGKVLSFSNNNKENVKF
ncbi:MAG: hypothetical protein IKG40_02995 [Bacilli bacterium]|nr:hypothetical protein [Bacilli bacterium]